MQNRIGADIQANLRRQRLHQGLVADESRFDQSLGRSFNRALQRDFRQWPYHRGGDGGQVLAALQKLVKHVIVGGVGNQRIDNDSFGNGGQIAHGGIS